MLGGNPAMDLHPIQGGVEILLVASCYRHRDKLRPDGPLGSYADLTSILIISVFIIRITDLKSGAQTQTYKTKVNRNKDHQ